MLAQRKLVFAMRAAVVAALLVVTTQGQANPTISAFRGANPLVAAQIAVLNDESQPALIKTAGEAVGQNLRQQCIAKILELNQNINNPSLAVSKLNELNNYITEFLNRVIGAAKGNANNKLNEFQNKMLLDFAAQLEKTLKHFHEEIGRADAAIRGSNFGEYERARLRRESEAACLSATTFNL